ncbi:hypothetical protein ONZ45_g1150 [Pleurotus djamor]|nr:hypothetical protein ONZ45_g1150 [Pleurotus djamor]
MVALPNELWYEVLFYLPEVEANRLMSVNRVFYNHVWSHRYKEVLLLKVTPRSLKRAKLMSGDSYIASRVLQLSILLSELRNFELALRGSTSAPTSPYSSGEVSASPSNSARLHQSWLSILSSLSCIRDQRPQSVSLDLPPRQPSRDSTNHIFYPTLSQLLKDVVNLEQITIIWNSPNDALDISPLLATVWSMRTLRRLSLHVGTGGLYEVLSNVPEACSLESIHVKFPNNQLLNSRRETSTSSTVPVYARESTSQSMLALAHLINASSKTLTNLQISCHEHIFPFFAHLFSNVLLLPALSSLRLHVTCKANPSFGEAQGVLSSFLEERVPVLTALSLDFSGINHSMIQYAPFLTTLRSLEITPYGNGDAGSGTTIAFDTLARFPSSESSSEPSHYLV